MRGQPARAENMQTGGEGAKSPAKLRLRKLSITYWKEPKRARKWAAAKQKR